MIKKINSLILLIIVVFSIQNCVFADSNFNSRSKSGIIQFSCPGNQQLNISSPFVFNMIEKLSEKGINFNLFSSYNPIAKKYNHTVNISGITDENFKSNLPSITLFLANLFGNIPDKVRIADILLSDNENHLIWQEYNIDFTNNFKIKSKIAELCGVQSFGEIKVKDLQNVKIEFYFRGDQSVLSLNIL